jgi:hypothetical protein
MNMDRIPPALDNDYHTLVSNLEELIGQLKAFNQSGAALCVEEMEVFESIFIQMLDLVAVDLESAANEDIFEERVNRNGKAVKHVQIELGDLITGRSEDDWLLDYLCNGVEDHRQEIIRRVIG